MQMVIDSLRKSPADALNPGEIRDTGLKNALQTAELAQQRAATLRSETGNGLQAGSPPGLRAALPVPGNCKSVRLIANLLNQVQGRGICRQCDQASSARQNQLFFARPSFGPLRNPEQG